MMRGKLILEDGTEFDGELFGAQGIAVGEVVFNTSMTGYQEIMTDPSYAGQLVTLTHPHIGNYGTNARDTESDSIQVRGLIVREISTLASNHLSEASLPDWLAEQGVAALSGIDTRSLTRHLRDGGVLKGAFGPTESESQRDAIVEALHAAPAYAEQSFVDEVSVSSPTAVRISGESGDGDLAFSEFDASAGAESAGPHVVVLDFGVKHSILRHLCQRGCRVTLVPYTSDVSVLENLKPDGILISNGPGDPARLDPHLDGVRDICEAFPTFGICLGHQLIARAYGAKTYKLQFGHRGPNQPVQCLATGRIEMTSQNHGYAVRTAAMMDDFEVTHVNLNDETVEGFRHKTRPIFAVQYHPEAGPGPNDAVGFFDDFVAAIRR